MASCLPTPNDSDSQPTLVDLLIDSGIASPYTVHETALNTDWVFCVDISELDPAISAACAKQLEFVRAFKSGWASSEPYALGIPEKWQLDANSKTWILSDHMHAAALLRWLRPIEDELTFISTSDIVERHENFEHFLPDFLLHAPHIPDYPIETESYDWTSSTYSLPFFLEIISYPGDEASADMAIPGFFQPTPNCTLVSDVVYDFPPPLLVHCQHSNKTFAVLESSFKPLSPSHHKIKASLSRPTLLVGMKGPTRWPTPLANLIRMSQPASVHTSLDQTLLDLVRCIEPNLFALLMNWHYRCERNNDGIGKPSYRRIPTWLMQFGLIYDAEGLIIVAHIPFLSTPSSSTSAPLSFLSCVVDRILMPGLAGILPSSASHDAPILSNLRAALSLSCLQRHAFVMSALMEGVSWPPSIVQKDIGDEDKARA